MQCVTLFCAPSFVYYDLVDQIMCPSFMVMSMSISFVVSILFESVHVLYACIKPHRPTNAVIDFGHYMILINSKSRCQF